jgi:YihY family inner membrane protein
MPATLDSSTPGAAPAAVAPAARAGPFRAVARKLQKQALPTLKYLASTEVHTFAFSVAANAILSFFPFVVLLMTIIRRVFHSKSMYNVVLQLLRDYLPSNQDFVIRNLNVLVVERQGLQVVSLVILLITSTGVFLPLEVALNKVWGFPRNRSYLGNQLMSLGLAFGCGVLGLISIALTAGNQVLLARVLGENFVVLGVGWVTMKIFAFVATVSIFFLVFWLLPNGKVRARWVLPAAVVSGLLLELAKYVYILLLPRLNFQEAYGPFSISVTLIMWAFVSGLLLLGGAHLSAVGRQVEEPEP